MRGYSLLEVMIALFILAYGLLGVIALHASVLQRNYAAYLDSLAANQISSGFDRAESGWLNNETQLWNNESSQILPQGSGKLSARQISLCWFDSVKRKQKCLRV